MLELQKQLKEERQVMELRKLQEDAGLVKKSMGRVDWMYEGPAAADNGPSAEEYLLGKEYKGEAGSDDVQDLATKVAEKPGSLWLQKTTTANESFRRRTEDPLVAIRLREQAARERILANPLRMQKIRQAVRVMRVEFGLAGGGAGVCCCVHVLAGVFYLLTRPRACVTPSLLCRLVRR